MLPGGFLTLRFHRDLLIRCLNKPFLETLNCIEILSRIFESILIGLSNRKWKKTCHFLQALWRWVSNDDVQRVSYYFLMLLLYFNFFRAVHVYTVTVQMVSTWLGYCVLRNYKAFLLVIVLCQLRWTLIRPVSNRCLCFSKSCKHFTHKNCILWITVCFEFCLNV